MNNLVLYYLRSSLNNYPGNYLEVGSEDGGLIAVLAREFPNKKFISLDNDPNNFVAIMNSIKGKLNINFYSTSVEDFNQTLTEGTVLKNAVDTVFINSASEYSDYAEAIKLIARVFSSESGQVIFSNCSDSTVKLAIDEFRFLLGYRIVNQIQIDQEIVVYQIRHY